MSSNERNNVYCEAKFWRPTGLGNRLFPWARCKVFSELTGTRMLTPFWPHLRGASITRGGINYRDAYRKILLFDNFKPVEGEVGGLQKCLAGRRFPKTTVANLPEALSICAAEKTSHPRIFSFAGDREHIFDDIRPYQVQIVGALAKMTKAKWTRKEPDQPYIAINVRLGKDFKQANSASDFLVDRGSFLRTPLGWYIESLRLIRERAGVNLPAVVVSDGKANDLRQLLNEPNVRLGSTRSAIGDLHVLSRGSIFIGSGRSSFSAWASFLGQMPTVTIPGSSLESFRVSGDPARHYVGELDVDAPDDLFLQKIKTLNL